MQYRTLTLAAAGLIAVSSLAIAAQQTAQFQISGAVSKSKAILTTSDASALLAGTISNNGVKTGTSPVVNFEDPQDPGAAFHFQGKTPFIVDTPAIDNNFAIEAKGTLHIPSAGDYTFGANSDDGFSLNVGSFNVAHAGQRPASDTLGTFTFSQAGDYPLDLVYFQNIGQSEVELWASPGRYTTFGAPGSNFQLINSTATGALMLVNAVPEPGAAVLLLGAAAPLLIRRRRSPIR